jgi:hypothetical protein
MAIDTISTLSEFLRQSGVKYRVFDMGRRVVKLSADEFFSFEQATQPYPYPFKKSALFGLVFWNEEQTDNRYIWFLNFPLDEQGLLIQAARDEFLAMVLERVGECMLASDKSEEIEGALKDSPYAFKPREDRMAAFNAQVTHDLALKPSAYFDDVNAYFSGETTFDNWQSLGMQGFADFAARMDNADTLSLIESIPFVPVPPFMMLTTFLENVDISLSVVEIFCQRVNNELQQEQPNIEHIAACLRAVSNSTARGLVSQMVKQVLSHSCSQNIELLATISGRLWQSLEQQELCHLFVEQLAQNNAGQAAFSQLLADLMFIPNMRPHVMTALRSTNRSAELSKAVGEMFGR